MFHRSWDRCVHQGMRTDCKLKGSVYLARLCRELGVWRYMVYPGGRVHLGPEKPFLPLQIS